MTYDKSVVYDFRLPPDEKLGKDMKALLPDLSPFELEQLRTLIRGVQYWAAGDVRYARVILGPNGRGHSEMTLGKARDAIEPLFRKILAE